MKKIGEKSGRVCGACAIDEIETEVKVGEIRKNRTFKKEKIKAFTNTTLVWSKCGYDHCPNEKCLNHEKYCYHAEK